MNTRTDLAIESINNIKSSSDIIKEERFVDDIKITKITINDEKSAEKLGKQKGSYITIELGEYMRNGESFSAGEILRRELSSLLPDFKSMLIIGIGNIMITPDSIGPETAKKILATRHIEKHLADQIGLHGIKSVSVLSPGVLGQTGIEVQEIVKGAKNSVNADAVLLIDALVAKDLSRLGSCVQISNTGIVPGSGVGNHRSPLTEKELGVPVFSIGVPTVVDAPTLVYELTGNDKIRKNNMIITPREIDMVIERSSELLSYGINCAVQPKIDPETIMSLV